MIKLEQNVALPRGDGEELKANFIKVLKHKFAVLKDARKRAEQEA